MKISKILACLMAAIMLVTTLTAVVYADDDVLEDDYEVILDEGCLCGENGDCRKPCVTTAFEESKPITKKTSNIVTSTKPKVSETKLTVTTVTATEPKPVVTSAPAKSEPAVTATTSKEPEKEPPSVENGSLDFGGMFSDLLSMFGDMDFELSGLPIGDFGTDTPLTPDGNMTLVDDIYQNESHGKDEEEVIQSKQFITVQTKAGNVFYIIIDRSKEGENVYFLNLVDEADLFALMENAPETEAPAEPEKSAECICKGKDKCALGAVNTDCEVCKMDLTKCLGKEKPKEEVTPDVVEKTAPENEKKAVNPALLLLPLLVIGGGAAYWFLKIRKPSGKSKNKPNPDDYGFSEDSDDDFAEDSEEESIDETDNTDLEEDE